MRIVIFVVAWGTSVPPVADRLTQFCVFVTNQVNAPLPLLVRIYV
jgi:hypothetical protein